MKHRITHIVLLLTAACNLAAQTLVSGIVSDGKEPLAGANVFIIGTIDGCLTDSLGRFSFATSAAGEVTLLRIEPYWKKYRHLPLLVEGAYQSSGYGTSRGVDFFLEDHSLSKRLATTLSYSFNDSERLCLDYPELQTPDYVSRHNLRLTAKYAIGKVIVGLSESYASGRHFPAGTTPHYNSVDVNLTYLLSPKVIVYTSLNNVFGRTNIFRYDANGAPVVPSRDRFLYIGIFVSLKNNKAYDISNF